MSTVAASSGWVGLRALQAEQSRVSGKRVLLEQQHESTHVHRKSLPSAPRVDMNAVVGISGIARLTLRVERSGKVIVPAQQRLSFSALRCCRSEKKKFRSRLRDTHMPPNFSRAVVACLNRACCTHAS